jgi:hypothetical protein
MSLDGNGNAGSVKLDIIKNLFWGWPIVKPWFRRKPRVVVNTGMDYHAALDAFSFLFFCTRVSFGIVFFLFISIPIGIIRLLITIIPILVKKRENTANTNAGN